jgi:hypothetical protein
MGAMGDPGSDGSGGDPGTMGDPGAPGAQGPGAVQLRYNQATPNAGANAPDLKLATVGNFEYWGGCNIDGANSVSTTLWVIPTAGTFTAIGHVSWQIDDTGAFSDANIHGSGLTGSIPIDTWSVATTHFVRAMNGPLLVHNATAMQTVSYTELSDSRPGSTSCTIVGTVTPAS